MAQRERQSMPSETAEECRTLDNVLYLLTCEWPIASEKMAGKRLSLLGLLRKVGTTRAVAAIHSCIANHTSQFCPPTSTIAGYVPEVVPCSVLRDREAELEREKMRQDRREHPDDYFGEADVVAMLRIGLERKAKGQPALDAEAMIAEVLAVRTAIRERA